ncbi:MAG: amino acid permease [Odoribacteraceae bacterium]|jgi:APA family basic amino acid/polyamine antiporter|nr:amino acid permease [Odoribacteraceae bacterium]
MSNLWKTKSVEQLVSESKGHGKNQELKKVLTTWSLVALGIGAIIGAGLFSLTGIAAAEHAGPAVILSFVVAGVACLFSALCYAEFASMIPVAGSAYTYSYATFGEFMAWIIGWDLVLEYSLGAATVGVSWSQYFVKLLQQVGLTLPEALVRSPFEAGGIVNLPAVFIICAISMVLIRGTRGSSRFNNILVVLKIAVVAVFIILGWSFIDPGNHVPFIPENEGEFGHFGLSGIAMGAAVVFFAFIGFDAVSTAAQETVNPKKSMPRGIIGALLACTVLYVLFAYVMTGMVSYKEFAGDASPVARAFSVTGYTSIEFLLILAIVCGFTSVILVMLLGQSRVFYSMSKDGLLPRFFSDIHPAFKTPWKTNLFFMIFVALLAGLVPISDLGHMVSMGTLLAFTLVSVGIIILRARRPDIPRKFKTPFVPFIPAAGALVSLALMYSLPTISWYRLVIWMAIGLVIYFTYSRGHSRLNH